MILTSSLNNPSHSSYSHSFTVKMALQSFLEPIYLTDKPLLDTRTYKHIALPNALEVLLIHDAETDKASAALDVNVGSFADPENLNGLAHFCEHLLFMGTAKYPVVNEYRAYLASHSGSSNAYTVAEHTNFHFSIDHTSLHGTLDRFAQFFIHPLFNKSCQHSEVRAVDSENKKNLKNDIWRLHQLERSTSNLDHPVSKFCTGNLETLETGPAKQNIDVHARLLEFYNTQYSSNIMKLCIIGREPLDLLEQWAFTLFSPIKNLNLPPPAYPSAPYSHSHLGQLIQTRPVQDIKRLILKFPIPDQSNNYESKPTRYIAHCVGHEGIGSLFHFLKSRRWAVDLNACEINVAAGYDHFMIEIILTPAGLDHYEQVLSVIFQYLKLLASSPVHEWLFKELQTMAEVDFLYQEKSKAETTTSQFAAHMHKPIPNKWLLSSTLFRTFDSDIIAQTIAYLNPDNFRATLVAPSVHVDRVEKWYGTPYSVSRLSSELISTLKGVELNPHLSLPKPNQFLPTNLYVLRTLAAPASKSKRRPTLLKSSNQLKLWYKEDDTFGTPRARVRIYLRTPVAHSSPSNHAKTDLLIHMVEAALRSFAYDAEIAGLKWSASTTRDGVDLNASGYSEKLPVLLSHVLSGFKNLKFDEALFNFLKENTLTDYRNAALSSPYMQVGVHMDYLLNEQTWTPDEVEHALNDIQYGDMIFFVAEILRQTTAEIMVVGNLTERDAFNIADLTMQIITPLPQFALSQNVRLRSYILTDLSNAFYRYTIQLSPPTNVNSCTEVFCQVGMLTNDRLRVTLELLASIAQEPAFHFLRTQEQLGYIVFSGLRHTRTTFGYRILVQGSEHDASYLSSRVDKFLGTHLREKLTPTDNKSFTNENGNDNSNGLSLAKFDQFVSSLVAKKSAKFQNLEKEAEFYFDELSSGYYRFGGRERDIEILKTLEIQDVLNLYDEFIAPGGSGRACLVLNLEGEARKPTLSNAISLPAVDIDDLATFKSMLSLTAAPHLNCLTSQL